MKTRVCRNKKATTIHSKIVVKDIGGGFFACHPTCSFLGHNNLIKAPYCILMGALLTKQYKGDWISECRSKTKYFCDSL